VDVPIANDQAGAVGELRYRAGSEGERAISKVATTAWVVEERFNNFALVRFKPHHGRTHQIRIHALYMGHPILCDYMHVW
jgi:23S rRNA pseudouridine955/2504/2580 synthase